MNLLKQEFQQGKQVSYGKKHTQMFVTYSKCFLYFQKKGKLMYLNGINFRED